MSKKRTKDKLTIFNSIRKPTAPPNQKIGNNKPDEKVFPAARKTKHKKDINNEE